jgi:uncharacterized membrane protein YgcG
MRIAPRLSRLVATAAALVGLAGLVPTACGTDAVGIDACRRIERFRCKAAPYCPAFDTWTADDVTACEELYRDQCLHGVAAEEAPSDSQVDACITAINEAAACQERGVASMGACPAAPLVAGIDAAGTPPCEVITDHPERLLGCSFLYEAPDTSTSSTSGGGGSGGGGSGGGG